jgi:hypothetical protein
VTCSFLPNTTPTCFATFYSDEKEKLYVIKIERENEKKKVSVGFGKRL